MTLKKGDNVEIHQDPVTRKDFEDYAVLIKPMTTPAIDAENNIERWMVRFDDGTVVQRGILATTKEI